ncbi:translation initiation factor IF-2-like [Myotis myotis]|uniref:Uncharacterized protein n=1 Tax=Myotis myotis TaxID=51298 RepID=A0A7J7ZWY4_MYOMY|nr:translation initiation factor IF-2-like [Myotis myotis]KAF6378631.1 hypothetical protein mMyoMyo1_009563 [Myotis myotis]
MKALSFHMGSPLRPQLPQGPLPPPTPPPPAAALAPRGATRSGRDAGFPPPTPPWAHSPAPSQVGMPADLSSRKGWSPPGTSPLGSPCAEGRARWSGPRGDSSGTGCRGLAARPAGWTVSREVGSRMGVRWGTDHLPPTGPFPPLGAAPLAPSAGPAPGSRPPQLTFKDRTQGVPSGAGAAGGKAVPALLRAEASQRPHPSWFWMGSPTPRGLGCSRPALPRNGGHVAHFQQSCSSRGRTLSQGDGQPPGRRDFSAAPAFWVLAGPSLRRAHASRAFQELFLFVLTFIEETEIHRGLNCPRLSPEGAGSWERGRDPLTTPSHQWSARGPPSGLEWPPRRTAPATARGSLRRGSNKRNRFPTLSCPVQEPCRICLQILSFSLRRP